MQATAIVPVKRFDAAKQRLSDVLQPGVRATLAAAMLVDVLTALNRCELIDRTLVVSGEPAVGPIASRASVELIDDPDDRGHSEAALRGIERALASGTTAVALLPGDCPLLDPGELDSALAGLGEGSAGVIPDRAGTGTNGLLLRPPDAIAPSFGPGSCARHLALAEAAGVAGSKLPLRSLGLDLDTGGDLEALSAALARPERSSAAPATAAALRELELDTSGVPR